MGPASLLEATTFSSTQLNLHGRPVVPSFGSRSGEALNRLSRRSDTCGLVKVRLVAEVYDLTAGELRHPRVERALALLGLTERQQHTAPVS